MGKSLESKDKTPVQSVPYYRAAACCKLLDVLDVLGVHLYRPIIHGYFSAVLQAKFFIDSR